MRNTKDDTTLSRKYSLSLFGIFIKKIILEVMKLKNPNGTGSVYKLRGNRRKPWVAVKTVRWEMTEDDKVKQVKVTVGTYATKNEAIAALGNFDVNKDITAKDSVLFKEIYQKWWERYKSKFTPSTIKVYESMYNKYLSKLDNKNFKALKYKDLEEFTDEIEAKSSLKTVIAILKDIYIYAIKLEVVSIDYSAYIEVEKGEVKIQRKIFTKKEIDILWENSENRWVMITLILLYTGVRVNELLELNRNNININENYFITGSKTEAGKDRWIPIHKRIKPLFERFLSDEKQKVIVDEEKRLITYQTYRNKFKKMIEELGLEEHTIHDTRHTFISRMDSLNVNKVALIKLVGHSNIKTSEKTYTHKTSNELEEAIDILEY